MSKGGKLNISNLPARRPFGRRRKVCPFSGENCHLVQHGGCHLAPPRRLSPSAARRLSPSAARRLSPSSATTEAVT